MARKTINYAQHMRCWGHDFAITAVEGETLQATGWYTGPEGTHMQRGDFVLFPNPKTGKTSRYAALEVTNYPSPRDMWSATLRFAPRPVGLSEGEAHELAKRWFAGPPSEVPWMAKELAEERCAKFGGCSEVILGAYFDFLRGTEPT